MYEVGHIIYSRRKHAHDTLAIVIGDVDYQKLPDISGVLFLSLDGVSLGANIDEVVKLASFSLFGFDRAPDGSQFDLIGTLDASQVVQICKRSPLNIIKNLQKSPQTKGFLPKGKK